MVLVSTAIPLLLALIACINASPLGPTRADRRSIIDLSNQYFAATNDELQGDQPSSHPMRTIASTKGSQTTFGTIAPVQDQTKVQVQLAVMSRCPDAELCESVFDRVLSQVGSLVDISLLYIGSIDKEDEKKVECKHGELECQGNKDQLCAAKYWQGVSGAINPWADWWNFVQCMNYNGLSKVGTPRLAENCAKIIGRDWSSGPSTCSTSSEGQDLLIDSVRTTERLKLQKSCSIVIEGELVCIRDGKWYDCEEGHEVGDFVRQIRQAWKRLNA